MRTQTVKVNSRVTWITATGKLKPAIVTAVTNQTTVNLRIGRSGGTVSGAVKQNADNQASRWRFSDAYQNT